jgi:hypothetical protein
MQWGCRPNGGKAEAGKAGAFSLPAAPSHGKLGNRKLTLHNKSCWLPAESKQGLHPKADTLAMARCTIAKVTGSMHSMSATVLLQERRFSPTTSSNGTQRSAALWTGSLLETCKLGATCESCQAARRACVCLRSTAVPTPSTHDKPNSITARQLQPTASLLSWPGFCISQAQSLYRP